MRERLGVIAILVGVLIDVVLVTLAIRHVRPVDVESARSDTPSASSARGSDDASGTASGGASDTATSAGTAGAPTYLSVASDGSLVRATRGSCAAETQPVVEVATGLENSPESIEVAEDLTEVLWVRANGASDLRLVGANAECELGVYVTEDAGASWTRTPGTVGIWHLLPRKSRAAVHSPEGVVDLPCVPTGLSTLDAGVVNVLCRDDRVVGTVDNGLSWSPVTELGNAAAMQWTSATQAYALAGQGGCGAAVLSSIDTGASWNRLTCLGDEAPAAIDAAGDLVVAEVGQTLHVSSDGGGEWATR